MHPEIEKRFEAIESRRKAMVDRVRKLPEDQRKHKPDTKAFSPVEVVMHFALTETVNVSFMRKNPPNSLKGKKARTGPLYRKVVAVMQDPKKRVATLPAMVPKGDVDLDAADEAWERVRMEIKSYLDQVEDPAEAFVKMMFVFGTLSGADYLTLVEAHHNYHEQWFPA